MLPITRKNIAKVFAEKGDHKFAVFMLLRKHGFEMRGGSKVAYTSNLHLSLCKAVPQSAIDILNQQV